MDKSTGSLAEVLGLGPREHVALVGGGGKTSLMLALGRELRASGKRVVASTTTKIWRREAFNLPLVLLRGREAAWMSTVEETLEARGHLFLGQEILDSGKVKGIMPAVLDGIFRDLEVDFIIAEADGSAGHPVKAHEEHEPVIAGSSTRVVAVMGLEALGRPAGPDLIFRAERFYRLTGAGDGEPLTPSLLAGLFLNPGGIFKGSPDSAERIPFLNKADLLAHAEEALALASLLHKGPGEGIRRVVIGSLRAGRYRAVLPEND